MTEETFWEIRNFICEFLYTFYVSEIEGQKLGKSNFLAISNYVDVNESELAFEGMISSAIDLEIKISRYRYQKVCDMQSSLTLTMMITV
jgi:hypothetical protein